MWRQRRHGCGAKYDDGPEPLAACGAYLGVDPYAWRSVGIGTKNCDWGKVDWETMAGNATIVTLMQNASREARELEALASDEADFWPLTPIDPSHELRGSCIVQAKVTDM
jgi:hypothetical protein